MDDSCSMHCGNVNCIQQPDREDLLKQLALQRKTRMLRIFETRFGVNKEQIFCLLCFVDLHPVTARVNDQIDVQLRYIIRLLLQSSTCFEQLCAHHQEVRCINTTSGIVLRYIIRLLL